VDGKYCVSVLVVVGWIRRGEGCCSREWMMLHLLAMVGHEELWAQLEVVGWFDVMIRRLRVFSEDHQAVIPMFWWMFSISSLYFFWWIITCDNRVANREVALGKGDNCPLAALRSIWIYSFECFVDEYWSIGPSNSFNWVESVEVTKKGSCVSVFFFAEVILFCKFLGLIGHTSPMNIFLVKGFRTWSRGKTGLDDAFLMRLHLWRDICDDELYSELRCCNEISHIKRDSACRSGTRWRCFWKTTT